MSCILSGEGVLFKNHLLNGVKKNALTLEQVDSKFQAWIDDKEKKLQEKISASIDDKTKTKKQKLEAEVKVREAKAAAINKKAQEANAAAQKPAESEEAAS